MALKQGAFYQPNCMVHSFAQMGRVQSFHVRHDYISCISARQHNNSRCPDTIQRQAISRNNARSNSTIYKISVIWTPSQIRKITQIVPFYRPNNYIYKIMFLYHLPCKTTVRGGLYRGVLLHNQGYIRSNILRFKSRIKREQYSTAHEMA